ncbi:stage II sporulation protein D [Radiobacillus kanasensis]|uniref:stage II sporulation protein D n=1 Tax=Radiobacillus kanasensis TaxID=2844358 RepID=UPI001E31BB48|nr:stage II sporulation protein D [Radiobacillus kanasensis]UFT98916.1 stage II sporulation protein D [Radiobacillus kanasensis]
MKKFKQVNQNSWKKPSIILMTSLVSIILIIPTLIVVPFIQSGGEKQSVTTTKAAEQVSLNPSDSAFAVEVYRTDAKKVEEVPLESYVVRVVASEMPADFELEALKAQALAARTYVINFLEHNNKKIPEGADVTDTVQHQVYKNDEELRATWGSDYNWKMEKITKAVAQTKGEIITYEKQPITPAFFSTSNGYTENSEDYWSDKLPYLRSVESPWDLDSPKYMDQKILTVAEVEKALGITLDPNAKAVAKISHTEGKRVAEVVIGGKTFTGRDIRQKLELRSSDFDIEQKNNHLIFTTKGYGHGIGMSQYGANGMAKEGKSYKDIVTYYYQGAKVSTVDSAVPKLVTKLAAK